MDELIKQFNDAKKWKKQLTAAMILLIAAGVVIIIMGIVIEFLPLLFIIFGCILCAVGVNVNRL